jgi:hypothetical protein
LLRPAIRVIYIGTDRIHKIRSCFRSIINCDVQDVAMKGINGTGVNMNLCYMQNEGENVIENSGKEG